VKVDDVSVNGFIAVVNDAPRTVLTGTPVPAATGNVEFTVGAVESEVVPVVKVHT